MFCFHKKFLRGMIRMCKLESKHLKVDVAVGLFSSSWSTRNWEGQEKVHYKTTHLSISTCLDSIILPLILKYSDNEDSLIKPSFIHWTRIAIVYIFSHTMKECIFSKKCHSWAFFCTNWCILLYHAGYNEYFPFTV